MAKSALRKTENVIRARPRSVDQQIEDMMNGTATASPDVAPEPAEEEQPDEEETAANKPKKVSALRAMMNMLSGRK